jgi:anaerobic magnesium-protoporphyrin IX monomethyl ester cyclase
MKVLFIRSPRHFWPIVNESDNFLLPLGYPCLAAYLREKMDDIKVEILDCCVQKIGWKSLASVLAEKKPDVVCVGELTIYYNEGFKTFRLAKQVNPKCITIAGGHIFSHLPEWTLNTCPEIDYVVMYEGEETLRELLETLRNGRSLSGVAGIAYRDGNKVVINPPRPVIENLDTLPIPAYDIASLEKYSPFGNLWPRAITVQRGRGCIDSCNFCSWWVMEGKHELVDGKIVPVKYYRTKSVERMVSEIELLYEKHGVRYLFWVDGTWNIDDKWLDSFCTEIIKRKYKLGWWAFIRTDFLVEQEKSGVLEKMVRAGLRHVLVGVERATNEDINWVKKSGYTREKTKEAFHILKTKYPEVFRQGTILTGIRTDTEKSIKNLLAYAHEIDMDFAAFHPIMPFPGTPLWDSAKKEGWIEENDYSNYDMFFPIMPSEQLSREEISKHTQWNYQNFIGKKPFRYFSRLFSPHQIRRRLHWWFLFAVLRVLMTDLYNSAMGRKKFEGFAAVNKMWKPSYYDD